MANLIEPDKILMHFLRSVTDEITRVDYSDRLTTSSESFNGNASDTEFTLSESQSVDSITSITVDGSPVYAYTDYDIDLSQKKITFLSAPASGTNNVVVNYKRGSSWIFPDKVREDLNWQSYPRVGVNVLIESGFREGIAEDDTFDTVTFQIDCVAQKDMACTINGETKYGQDVANYLSRQIKSKLTKNWRNVLSGKLFDPVVLNRQSVPFNDMLNTFTDVVEVRYNGFNIGE